MNEGWTKVLSSFSQPEIGFVQSLLDSRDIPVSLEGEFAQLTIPYYGRASSTIDVFVPDEYVAEAQDLLAHAEQRMQSVSAEDDVEWAELMATDDPDEVAYVHATLSQNRVPVALEDLDGEDTGSRISVPATQLERARAIVADPDATELDYDWIVLLEDLKRDDLMFIHGILENHGIQAFVRDELDGEMAQLFVPDEDREEALAVLDNIFKSSQGE